MSNSISTVIREIKHHRNAFMKKSTPYRQLNRAIKQLEKLEKIKRIILYDCVEKQEQIEKIVERVKSLHPEIAIGDREGISKIREVMDREFCIDYILDDCHDCPEREKGIKCQTGSNCFKVKEKIISDLRKLDRIEQIVNDVQHQEVASARPYFGTIQKIKKVLEQE